MCLCFIFFSCFLFIVCSLNLFGYKQIPRHRLFPRCQITVAITRPRRFINSNTQALVVRTTPAITPRAATQALAAEVVAVGTALGITTTKRAHRRRPTLVTMSTLGRRHPWPPASCATTSTLGWRDHPDHRPPLRHRATKMTRRNRAAVVTKTTSRRTAATATVAISAVPSASSNVTSRRTATAISSRRRHPGRVSRRSRRLRRTTNRRRRRPSRARR